MQSGTLRLRQNWKWPKMSRIARKVSTDMWAVSRSTGKIQTHCLTGQGKYSLVLLIRQRFSVSSSLPSLPAQLGCRAPGQISTTMHEQLLCSLWQGLNPQKSVGSEEIHPRILREVADIGARPLSVRSLQDLDIIDISCAESNQSLQNVIGKGTK